MSTKAARLLVVTVAVVACGALVYIADPAGNKEVKAAKKSGSPYDVPDGSPKDLLDFIRKTQKQRAVGDSRRERMDYLRNANLAILKAAQRITEAGADDSTTVAALRAEVGALTMLKRLGDNDAGEQLAALTEKLQNDQRPGVVYMLKRQSLQEKMEKLKPTDAKGAASFVNDVKALLSSGPPDLGVVPLAQRAMMILFRGGQEEEAAELAQQWGGLLAQSDDPDVAAASVQLLAPAGQMLGVLKRPDEATRLFDKYLDDFAKRDEPQFQVATVQLAEAAGQSLQSEGRDAEAAKLYKDVASRLADSSEPMVREALEQLKGRAHKLELVGQSMPISGKLISGGRFDIARFKGRVVLVDFWATWCGPCIAELPNVRQTYDKYHERGFEVVGISLDNDAEALTKFMEEEQLPWPIIFEEGHPLAKQYGVESIPMAVLINRQGKVVTLGARGEKLGELVAELLGPDDSNGEESDGAGSKTDKKAG